mmetsp:Transcript_4361/g.8383  ORF Transcript_4361/g.8383 Transcript_4361/m.8383 type:complete len:310 (+) Transcript_4361:553-1482(+)
MAGLVRGACAERDGRCCCRCSAGYSSVVLAALASVACGSEEPTRRKGVTVGELSPRAVQTRGWVPQRGVQGKAVEDREPPFSVQVGWGWVRHGGDRRFRKEDSKVGAVVVCWFTRPRRVHRGGSDRGCSRDAVGHCRVAWNTSILHVDVPKAVPTAPIGVRMFSIQDHGDAVWRYGETIAVVIEKEPYAELRQLRDGNEAVRCTREVLKHHGLAKRRWIGARHEHLGEALRLGVYHVARCAESTHRRTCYFKVVFLGCPLLRDVLECPGINDASDCTCRPVGPKVVVGRRGGEDGGVVATCSRHPQPFV